MRVLMQGRKNLFSLRGGDTIQLLKTKEKLEEMGITVDISVDINPDLQGYDIVHLSNLTFVGDTYLQMKNAKRQYKPVVLSTIYWPYEEFEKEGQIGIRRALNSVFGLNNIKRLTETARYFRNPSIGNTTAKLYFTVGYLQMQKYVVQNADFFLPNAEMEMDLVKKTFNLKNDNYIVVPNAVDIDLVNKTLNYNNINEYKMYKDAIICVGRIETRKNQLALVKALMNTDYKLLIVGAVSNNHKAYFGKIMKYINKNPNFYYLSNVDNEKIYELFKMCKVSALPSWLDTPGLVSLEAASVGCNIVVSTRGTTREYFGDYASYCEPDSIDSIRTAVNNAFKKPNNGELAKVIRDRYTWDIAAEQTLKGYECLLRCKG